ncbi:MAG: zf-HC2 domain-containing protein [Syntrophothermus sp.]
MSSKNELICEEFSREMWKMLDGTLTETETAFWEKHASECPECRALFEETEKILSVYETVPAHDISEEKFNLMIKNLERPGLLRMFLNRVQNVISETAGNFSFLRHKKTAFALSFAFTLVFLFLVYRPDSRDNLKTERSILPEVKTLTQTGSEVRREMNLAQQTDGAALQMPEVKQKARPRRVFVKWDTDNVKSGISQVNSSIEGMETGLGAKDRHSEYWMVSAAEMAREIARLEKELKESAF